MSSGHGPRTIDIDSPQQGHTRGAAMPAKELARFCHTVGSSLHAGIDVRRIFELEASRGSPRYRSKLGGVSASISQGNTVAQSLNLHRGYFPSLLCEMVDVGERTGRLEQIFLRLSEYYDNMVKLRRTFIQGIAWPMLELMLGLAVIGGFILIVGMISDEPPITFFGLYGVEGFMIYCGVLGLIAAVIGGVIAGAHYRVIDLDPFIRILYSLPFLGNALRTIAMARLTWSLAMATDSDIDAKRATELAVRTTNNSYFTSHIEGMQNMIDRGRPLHDAFSMPRVFPGDFLDSLETGEISGRISETMAVLAKDYEERSKAVFKTLATILGVLIMLLVAGFMILMIFSMFMQYVGILSDPMGDGGM